MVLAESICIKYFKSFKNKVIYLLNSDNDFIDKDEYNF